MSTFADHAAAFTATLLKLAPRARDYPQWKDCVRDLYWIAEDIGHSLCEGTAGVEELRACAADLGRALDRIVEYDRAAEDPDVGYYRRSICRRVGRLLERARQLEDAAQLIA